MIYPLLSLLIVLLFLIIAVSRWKWHPFVVLLLSGISLGLALGFGGVQTIEVLMEGFAKTLKWIAVVVIIGAFIGEVLRETGGALRIADRVVKWVGEKRISWAMGITGYIVSIPVFVDVAYIILQPVTEALSTRSKKPVLMIGLALTAGLTISHTLLPPTPGPLAVASLLEVNLGRMLMINAVVGIFAMVGGIFFVNRFCKNQWIAYDEKLRSNLINTDKPQDENTPSHQQWILFDLLPIIVPIVLMAAGAFFEKEDSRLVARLTQFVSIPMVAVSVGALIAWFQFRRKSPKQSANSLMEQAIVKSALVIMITGAGGAFGHIIRESGIQDGLTTFFETAPSLGFILPFLVAAVLTTATGSITVSLIGTASIVGPIAASMPYSPEMMAALIGCGSFCVFHANSSFFWLLNRLHEVPVDKLYRNYTLQSLVMGLSGLLGVLMLWILGVS